MSVYIINNMVVLDRDEYQAIVKHRLNGTQSNVVILPAFQMPRPKAD
jgi:hypothetical protein